jgi:hypothetical protein
MVTIMPTNVPKDVTQIVTQISQSVQSAIPGAGIKKFEIQKIVMTFTAEELEAFQLKPYPNQIYEVTISNGALNFSKTQ